MLAKYYLLTLSHMSLILWTVHPNHDPFFLICWPRQAGR